MIHILVLHKSLSHVQGKITAQSASATQEKKPPGSRKFNSFDIEFDSIFTLWQLWQFSAKIFDATGQVSRHLRR